MKKVIRLTEADLTKIIQRVIQEQEMAQSKEKSPQQCEMIKKRALKNKSRGERLIKLFPKPLQGIMNKSFDAGIKGGVEAFFSAIPTEIRTEVKQKFDKSRKPKTDQELDVMITKAESGQHDMQEQTANWRDWVWLMGLLAIIIFVIYLKTKDYGEYCGQSIWWG